MLWPLLAGSWIEIGSDFRSVSFEFHGESERQGDCRLYRNRPYGAVQPHNIHETSRGGSGSGLRRIWDQSRRSREDCWHQSKNVEGFSPAAGDEGDSGSRCLFSRPLAPAAHHTRLPGRQRCLRREAGFGLPRRRQAHGGSSPPLQTHRSSGHSAAFGPSLSESRGVGSKRRDRQGELHPNLELRQ